MFQHEATGYKELRFRVEEDARSSAEWHTRCGYRVERFTDDCGRHVVRLHGATEGQA